jgi:hypothetical protein
MAQANLAIIRVASRTKLLSGDISKSLKKKRIILIFLYLNKMVSIQEEGETDLVATYKPHTGTLLRALRNAAFGLALLRESSGREQRPRA